MNDSQLSWVSFFSGTILKRTFPSTATGSPDELAAERILTSPVSKRAGFHPGERNVFTIGYRSVSFKMHIRFVPLLKRQFLTRKSPRADDAKENSSALSNDGMSEK